MKNNPNTFFAISKAQISGINTNFFRKERIAQWSKRVLAKETTPNEKLTALQNAAEFGCEYSQYILIEIYTGRERGYFPYPYAEKEKLQISALANLVKTDFSAAIDYARLALDRGNFRPLQCLGLAYIGKKFFSEEPQTNTDKGIKCLKESALVPEAVALSYLANEHFGKKNKPFSKQDVLNLFNQEMDIIEQLEGAFLGKYIRKYTKENGTRSTEEVDFSITKDNIKIINALIEIEEKGDPIVKKKAENALKTLCEKSINARVIREKYATENQTQVTYKK